MWSKKFEPVRHGQPFKDGAPRHWNCRSITVPLLLDDDVRDMTFHEWFGELREAEQKHMFGKAQAKMYRREILGVFDLARQANRPLALE